jgi:pimeloyl-ACP methyl ester carboxylesterase
MPRLRVRDIDLYYESSGEGQPLLFIHGLGATGQDWERQVAFFSQHYRVITLDLRGHGRSDKPRQRYSIPQFADDVAALLQSLDSHPAHVVGLSLGGMVAFQLAAAHPHLLQSLVVVNSGPEMPSNTWKQRLGLLILLAQRWLIVRLYGMRKMGEVLSERLLPLPEHAEERRVFVERWAANDKNAYLKATYALRGWSVADQLGDIHCPTLIISADQDYTPVAFKEAYVAKMPNAELAIIHDSRHYSNVERPEQFNETLMAFLAKQVPTERAHTT